ncbi:glutamyl-tRNA reductase [Robiginitalea sp. SC105]|uniref:glutamyl-tRNA reductase n=1 Tax=Robiginitalea sp. SC105 TaxID=2762332 RepID=UPI00163B2FB8|nr:glutamyl-tRNA reductase [Robiginitalea sp. SC105]MBC2838334.1 glutamyl-tRNA reductase [Robiginitalea sp. SC105]
MKKYHISRHHRFITVGLNYEKADAATRGLFALDDDSIEILLDRALEEGIDGLLVTSTCNRTELHGFASAPQHLIRLLCDYSNGTETDFDRVGYVYQNQEAIGHLFRVGTGLDSQILGDFEIISQLKKSFKLSRRHGLANPFMERLVNSVIQASKRIKNETGISSGATSVAFASVQYLLARVPDISRKKILLYGTGKIGRNTCENLVKHTGHDQITLINRTRERADALGRKLNVRVRPAEAIREEIAACDVLIVATGATLPTVTASMVPADKPRWILDLTIPINVATGVGELPGITLVHLDRLSRITDDTLAQRKRFIPEAEAIIGEVLADFNQWLESRRFAPVIRALKAKLKTMKEEELDFQARKIEGFDASQADVVTDRIIQKITRHFANHLKDSEIDTEESLELIQKVFQLEIPER